MSEIAKMAIKWPKLKNDYFLLKKQFYYLSIILYQLSFINIYNSRPRNIENSITSDESMKIMILSKMAQKWSKWPTEAFINHRLGQIGDIESLKHFWKRQVFSQWFGVESPSSGFAFLYPSQEFQGNISKLSFSILVGESKKVGRNFQN